MGLTRRLVATLLVGALAGAVATPEAALAAAKVKVTFTVGTPSALGGCSSIPDVRSLRVPAESTVLVVNRLGQRADLLVNGDDYGGVPADNQVGVTLHHGPVRLALVPACLVGGAPDVVTVEVTGAAPVSPAPTTSASPLLAGVPPVEDDGAVEVTRAGPVPAPGHVSGLLVLVAAVLIVGVSIMAIRAKLAERTTTIRSSRQARHA